MNYFPKTSVYSGIHPSEIKLSSRYASTGTKYFLKTIYFTINLEVIQIFDSTV